VFSTDATITTPGGRAQGVEAIRAQASANHLPDVVTQHLLVDLVLDIEGDRATARANSVNVFARGEGRYAPPSVFRIGAVSRFELARTSDGWRIATMLMQPIWADGERPA
jgi:hypothetical protein